MSKVPGWMIIVLLSVLTVFGCKSRTINDHKSPGELWLSWSASEKDNIVYGYIQGYEDGMYRACTAAGKLGEDDAKFYTSKGIRRESISYSRCRAGVDEFSNYRLDKNGQPDFSVYSGTITEFYSAYPEYRSIPPLYLMQFLNGKDHKVAKDLYLMGKSGELRTFW